MLHFQHPISFVFEGKSSTPQTTPKPPRLEVSSQAPSSNYVPPSSSYNSSSSAMASDANVSSNPFAILSRKVDECVFEICPFIL